MVKSSWLYARSFNATFPPCLLTRRHYYKWFYHYNTLKAKDCFYSDSKFNSFYLPDQKCFQSLSSIHVLYLFFLSPVIHCEVPLTIYNSVWHPFPHILHSTFSALRYAKLLYRLLSEGWQLCVSQGYKPKIAFCCSSIIHETIVSIYLISINSHMIEMYDKLT